VLQDSLSIGRDGSNDLVLNDDGVSRSHALIRKQGGEFVLVDLGSSNGTFVNGQPVGAPHPLQGDDRLEIGGRGMLFMLDEPTPGVDAVPVTRGNRTLRVFTYSAVCILVSDIRNFTPLSARVTAEVLPPIITRWFQLAGELIQEHGGVFEKFRGDSVMAFWS
jgi:pSer/pThr/pTyr-binding forkhead associated (FHA) protein